MRKIIKYFAGAILLFNILSLIWVLIYRFIPIPITKLMVLEKRKAEVYYEWKNLEEISDKIQLAVMCAEDQYFLLHYGLDFASIDDAIKANSMGKKKRGASTISQQVAKNVFLWPGRDWIRKGTEFYFTLLIETLWSKERIMEVYLNVAEFGEGIFGVEAASKHYFKGSSSRLTTNQAARLAAVLPSPKKYSVLNPTSYVEDRVKWIKDQMKHWGYKMTYDEEYVRKMIQ